MPGNELAPDTIRPDGDGCVIECHIQPGASRSAIAGVYDGRVKLAVQAPPVDGKANQAVCDFFRKLLKLPSSRVRLISGETSRRKRIRLDGVDAEMLRTLISGQI